MADPDKSAESAPVEEGKPAESPATGVRPGDGALSCVEPPSFSSARSLVSSAHSCLVVNTRRRHLALPPKYLHRKRSGIQEQLNAELLKYNVRLGGVPVAYDNIKIVGEFGDIHDDVGYIHLTVEADYVIFLPQQGQKLVGVVNKVAPSHIGCLVHGCFNASIPKPLKMPIEAWQHVGVKVGDQMEFEVFRLDSDAVGVFCIRGRLERKVEAEVLERFEAAKEQTSEVFDDAQNDPEVDGETTTNKTIMITEETTKRKTKKRNFQESLPPDVSGEAEGCDVTSTSLEETPKKKLKKKKQDMVDASIESALVENTIMDSSCQSIGSSSRKARKKKHHQDSLPISDTETYAGTAESSILSLNDDFEASSGQEKIKKSKQKKHKDHSVLLDHSLQNGISEESALLQNETVVKMKTHKKKHKLSLSVQDPHLEANNGAAQLTSEGNLPNCSVPQAESSKQKKHKKKKHDHVLPGSGAAAAHLTEDITLSIGSQDFAEPKAKKKRK
ncbi:DNA-directed RNA polymerase I subunit RPA43 [Hyperolius riggenbachi]|uniref:DNA-directed RNA polymerase I subunit RPA43 n=1 Tax=Hyperolius riggenbachi TaxID=752182 RepID=UPI0035A27EE2